MLKSNINWNCKQIAKMYDKGTIIFNNAVQRGFVWDKKRQSLLIHTILYGYAIPPFYTIKAEDGTYDCMDGKQRSRAIVDFRNDTLALVDVPSVMLEDGTEFELEGKKYSDLPEELKDIFDSYSLTVYFFTDITDDESCELMRRLNNGKPLSAFELSRIKAQSLEKIKEIGRNELFTSALTEKAMNSYVNEDLVVKSYAALYEAEPCFDTKVIRPMIETMEITPEQELEMTAVFNRIHDAYGTIINGQLVDDKKMSKRVAKRMITRTHMVSIVPITARSIKENVSGTDYAKFLYDFFGTEDKAPTIDAEYNANCVSGSAHKEQVRIRLEAVTKAYAEFFPGVVENVMPEPEDKVEDLPFN